MGKDITDSAGETSTTNPWFWRRQSRRGRGFEKSDKILLHSQVISHPVSQHFVTSRVFDEVPGWKTSGIPYKILLVFTLALLCPVTTVVNIACPFKCCTFIANVSMQPFVKFINGAMSFIFFLGEFLPWNIFCISLLFSRQYPRGASLRSQTPRGFSFFFLASKWSTSRIAPRCWLLSVGNSP